MAPATLSLKTLIQNAKHFKMPVFLAHAGVSRAQWDETARPFNFPAHARVDLSLSTDR